MKFLAILVLAIATFKGFLAEDDMTDKEMFLGIIKCAQHAVLVGIPEIGLPVHNPLKISRNISTSKSVANFDLDMDLENMEVEGIPWWNVTQMDDLTEIEGIPVFDYAIYWKMLALTGELKVAVVENKTGRHLFEEEGKFRVELDHITFSGQFNITKFGEDSDPGFNNLTLHFHTEETKLNIDGMGILNSVINLVGGTMLKNLINSDALKNVAPFLKDKFNKDWIGKPERIEALITHCNSTLFN